MSKVVVTGLGFISSIGNSCASVRDSLVGLRSGIEIHPPFSDPSIPVKVLGTLKEFDTRSPDQEDWVFPQRYSLTRSFLRSLSPHVLYGYCALVDALADAGLDTGEVSEPETGMFTASAGSTSSMVHHVNYLHQHGVERAQPKGIVASIAGTLNFNLASAFGIQGATCGYVSACASSGHALAAAFEEIEAGRQRRMLVIGAEDGNEDCILPFAAMRALTRSADPDRASRPFDRDHDGFVGTGGAVAMILEAEEVAQARSARVYARMLGYGQASDGFNPVLPQPKGDGLARAMETALKRSGIRGDSVDYVNAHAPSTPHGRRRGGARPHPRLRDERALPLREQHEGPHRPRPFHVERSRGGDFRPRSSGGLRARVGQLRQPRGGRGEAPHPPRDPRPALPSRRLEQQRFRGIEREPRLRGGLSRRPPGPRSMGSHKPCGGSSR